MWYIQKPSSFTEKEISQNEAPRCKELEDTAPGRTELFLHEVLEGRETGGNPC